MNANIYTELERHKLIGRLLHIVGAMNDIQLEVLVEELERVIGLEPQCEPMLRLTGTRRTASRQCCKAPSVSSRIRRSNPTA